MRWDVPAFGCSLMQSAPERPVPCPQNFSIRKLCGFVVVAVCFFFLLLLGELKGVEGITENP